MDRTENASSSDGLGAAPPPLSPGPFDEAPAVPVSPSEAPTEPPTGRTDRRRLGRYEVLGRIAAGGMGVVYEGIDPQLQRKVALKILRADLSGADAAWMRARFLREAQAMARVRHPNVVPVHEIGTSGTLVFLAMELIEGQTLATWLQERPRSWREVRDVFVLAGRGLAAAHAAGLMHRDFKPDNVLVGVDGRVCVTDFGLARAIRELESKPAAPLDLSLEPEQSLVATRMTEPKALLGTPVYMAPEQHACLPADERSDQFAFCVSLYESLYGVRPFSGKNRVEIYQSILWGQLTPPPRWAHVPEHVRRALLKGLSFAPRDRFESMEALLAELNRPAWYARRRTLAVAAVALSLGLAGAGYLRGTSQRRQLCQGGTAKIQKAWGPLQRAQLRAAFEATPDLGDASKTLATVEHLLDDYAGTWARAHAEACEATHVRGEQSEALLDLRMQCLSRRQRELGAVVALLVRSPAEVARESTTASARLTPVAECSDSAALQGPAPRPRPTEEKAQAFEALEDELARAKALHDASQYRRALDIIQGLLPRAEALDDPSLRAEVVFWQGDLTVEVGDWKRGKELHHEAIWRATSARNDRIAARAWAGLTFIAGHFEHQHEEAHRYFQHGMALLPRLSDDEGLKAALLDAWGVSLSDNLAFTESETALREALRLRERAFGPESYHTLVTASHLANTYTRLERHDAALAMLERVLATHIALNGETHHSVLLDHINLSNALIRAGREDEAIPRAETAVRLGERLAPGSLELATALTNLGGLRMRQGHLTQAEAMHARALEMKERLLPSGHPRMTPDLRHLGEIELGLGRHQRAAEYLDRALSIGEAAWGADSPFLWNILTTAGRNLAAQKKFRPALGQLHRALALAQKGGDEREVAEVQLTLAGVLWESDGDRTRAARLARAARMVFEREGMRREEAAARAWLSSRNL